MFYNFSNHRSNIWPKERVEAIQKCWGQIIDIEFPLFPVEFSEEEVLSLAKDYIVTLNLGPKDAILIMGEYSFTFTVVDYLLSQNMNVFCIKSRQIRTSVQKEDGTTERVQRTFFLGNLPYQRYNGDLTYISKKNPVFLNCSAHYPSDSSWDDSIRNAASHYGEIKDYPIEAMHLMEAEIRDDTIRKILNDIDNITPSAILLDGDFFTFFMMADALCRKGYTVIIKCSNRNATETMNPDGSSTKISSFKFVRFRKLSRILNKGSEQ
jgi:hypothetical protein